MPEKEIFDLVILGSGSAAFAAAIKASELDARVAMAGQGILKQTCLPLTLISRLPWSKRGC